MAQENDTFSLVRKDDREKSCWLANVTLAQNDDSSNGHLLRLAVENDCEMTGEELFRLIDFPGKGSLRLQSEETRSSIESFDLDSIRRGEVVYQWDKKLSGIDRFSFELPLSHAPPSLKFKLICSSETLHLKLCANVEVSVGGAVSLGKDLLEATSPNNTPDEVLFTAGRPQHGHLIFRTESDSAVEVSSFSQTMVNDGQIIYQHAGEAAGVDHFRFNVVDRNGSTVGQRMFRIRIVDLD